MIDKIQIKDLIERVLKEYGLYSETATYLLLGTLAIESKFGTYLKQLGSGYALSIFQIEQPTFIYLKVKYQDRYRLHDIEFEELEYNLKWAILFCRLKYLSIPEKLPENKVSELARYWKQWYNTPKGAGTEKEFITNFNKYVRNIATD